MQEIPTAKKFTKPKGMNTTVSYINKSKIVYKWKGPLKLQQYKETVYNGIPYDIIDPVVYYKTVVKLDT